MLKWILFISFVLGISFFGMLYFVVTKDVQSGHVVPEDLSKQTIEMTYTTNSDVHRFTGEIRLPHSCYSLTNQATLDPKQYGVVHIAFSTYDKTSSAQVCSEFITGYLFDVVIEGPTTELTPIVSIDGNAMRAIVKKRQPSQFDVTP